jgi:hypothetical protein
MTDRRVEYTADPRMGHGLFSRLPADLWYSILWHSCQQDMLELAATCHESAAVFRNPQVWKDLELRALLTMHADC